MTDEKYVAKGAIRELRHNGFSLTCWFNDAARIERRLERLESGAARDMRYHYDDQGRLCGVDKDGERQETYTYDRQGRRISRLTASVALSHSADGPASYDGAGRLERAGSVSLDYDSQGRVSARRDPRGITRYSHGQDGLLVRILLPCGTRIEYEPDAAIPFLPGKRFRNGVVTSACRWSGPLRLAAWLDYEHGLEYSFWYDAAGRLDRLRLLPLVHAADTAKTDTDWLRVLLAQKCRERLLDLVGPAGAGMDLFCGCDQTGSPRVLTDHAGSLIKEVEYESFGLRRKETAPDLFLPLGFAGGYVDRDTGLVRLGRRDYFPDLGRFAAPEPLELGTRTVDPYAYCRNDPVGSMDRDGLNEEQVWEKPAWWQNLSRPVLLPQGHPCRDLARKGVELAVEGNMRSGGGPVKAAQIVAHAGAYPGLGPSAQDWAQANARRVREHEDYKRRKAAYLEEVRNTPLCR